MISGACNSLKRYIGIHENLDTAIRFLIENDIQAAAVGKHEISKDDVYMNVFKYDTMPLEAGKWEGHQQYADIHLVLQGEENIACANILALSRVGKYNNTDDFCAYEGKSECVIKLIPGSFLIAFPEDIHMPKLACESISLVKKVVVKVLMA